MFCKMDILDSSEMAVNSLAVAAEQFVEQSMSTKGDLLKWFLETVRLYIDLYVRRHMPKDVQLYMVGITIYETLICAF